MALHDDDLLLVNDSQDGNEAKKIKYSTLKSNIASDVGASDLQAVTDVGNTTTNGASFGSDNITLNANGKASFTSDGTQSDFRTHFLIEGAKATGGTNEAGLKVEPDFVRADSGTDNAGNTAITATAYQTTVNATWNKTINVFGKAPAAGITVDNTAGFFADKSLTDAGTNVYGFYSNLNEPTTAFNFYAGGTAPNFFQNDTYIGGTTTRNTRELWESTLTEEQKEELTAGTLAIPANVSTPGDGSFVRQWWYDQQSAEDQALIDSGELDYPERLQAANFTDTFALGDNTNINLNADGSQLFNGIGTWWSANIANAGDSGVEINRGLLTIKRANNSANSALRVFSGTENQFHVLGNGNVWANGDVNIGGNSSGPYEISLNADGSAEFSNTVTVTTPNGTSGFKVDNSDNNNTVVCFVDSNGDGEVDIKDKTGTPQIRLYGSDGGAYFGGSVDIGGTFSPSSPNISLNADGSGLFRKSLGVIDDALSYQTIGINGTISQGDGTKAEVISNRPVIDGSDANVYVYKSRPFYKNSGNFATLAHFNADVNTDSTGTGTLASQYGFLAGSNLSEYATNTYGFYSALDTSSTAGKTNYNFYAGDDAPNFFKGNTLIGNADDDPNITLNADGSGEFTGNIQAAGLTDGTTTKTMTEVLAGTGSSGSIKAWVNFDGKGTVSIRDQSNVDSITDQGTGKYDVNLTTPMPDANYAVSLQVNKGDVNDDGDYYACMGYDSRTLTTDVVPVTVVSISALGGQGPNFPRDTTIVCVAVFGN